MTTVRAPLILLAVEALLLLVVWVVVRFDRYRVHRRRLRCPLDGTSTIVYLGEWRTGEPSNVVRCRLRDSKKVGSCHEECVRPRAQTRTPDSHQ